MFVNKKIKGQFLLGLLTASLALTVQAGVIYEQGLLTDGSYGFISNTGGDLTADNFTLSTDATVDSISWFGSDEGSSAVFDVAIFSGTAMSSNVFNFSGSAASVVDTGFDDIYGFNIFKYSIETGGWNLAGGDEYLLSVANANGNSIDWYWADSEDGDGTTYYSDSINDWSEDNIGIDAAFILEGETVAAVPEPGTLMLMLIGVAGLVYSRRTIIS